MKQTTCDLWIIAPLPYPIDKLHAQRERLGWIDRVRSISDDVQLLFPPCDKQAGSDD